MCVNKNSNWTLDLLYGIDIPVDIIESSVFLPFLKQVTRRLPGASGPIIGGTRTSP